jgi:hypothetical protein
MDSTALIVLAFIRTDCRLFELIDTCCVLCGIQMVYGNTISAKTPVTKEHEFSFLIFCYPFVLQPHHFYAAPAPAREENFDAVPAAPAPTLLCSRSKCLKGIKS